jgi:uncharacterized membrane protein (DUF4010 family)
VLFVAVSIASYWAARRFGTAGVYALAAVVGISDINPFVLSLAQHGASGTSNTVGAVGVVVAASSNNLFQAAYATVYSGGRAGFPPLVALAILAACGVGAAVALAR